MGRQFKRPPDLSLWSPVDVGWEGNGLGHVAGGEQLFNALPDNPSYLPPDSAAELFGTSLSVSHFALSRGLVFQQPDDPPSASRREPDPAVLSSLLWFSLVPPLCHSLCVTRACALAHRPAYISV